MSNLFASVELVRRIEAAETRLITSVVQAVGNTGETVLLADVGGGSFTASRAGSPFNKLVGAGFERVDDEAFAAAEARALAVSGTVRAEIATLADPALVQALVNRGYRFGGYEHVLGRALADLAPYVPGDIEVRPARDDESVAWMDAVAIGFLSPDAPLSGVVHETFDREGFDQISRDTALVPALERWIAYRGGEVAGGGSLRIDDGIAQLCGAATVPGHRRMGVQAGLLRARLDDARRRGCEIAVVTTDPGSKSQANAQKAGFSLLYARAVWVLDRGLLGHGRRVVWSQGLDERKTRRKPLDGAAERRALSDHGSHRERAACEVEVVLVAEACGVLRAFDFVEARTIVGPGFQLRDVLAAMVLAAERDGARGVLVKPGLDAVGRDEAHKLRHELLVVPAFRWSTRELGGRRLARSPPAEIRHVVLVRDDAPHTLLDHFAKASLIEALRAVAPGVVGVDMPRDEPVRAPQHARDLGADASQGALDTSVLEPLPAIAADDLDGGGLGDRSELKEMRFAPEVGEHP